MSIQREEMGKSKLYTQSGKGEYKRKEMTGKTAQMINNLRQRKKWRKQMWRIKTETESRWKEIEGKSRDVFQCFNAGKKYLGNNKQEGKENQQSQGHPASRHPGKQLLPGQRWGPASKGLGRNLLSCLNIPALRGSLPFLLQTLTDPEVNEAAISSIRDSCVIPMIPDADITIPVTGENRSWSERDTSAT